MLIKLYEPERKKGVIEIPEQVKDRTDMVEQRAVVVAVGESAWADEGFWSPICFGLLRRWVVRPRAQVGDKVLVTKFAGYMTLGPADGQRYRLVNDRDIFAAITAEKEGAWQSSGPQERIPVQTEVRAA